MLYKKKLPVLFGLLFLYACGTPYGVYHRVGKGQTLYRISKTYGVKMDDIIVANRLDDPEEIKEGQVLFIPGAKKVLKVEPYNPQQSNKEEVRISSKKPFKRRSLATKRLNKKNKNLHFIWPVVGDITSGFGPRGGRNHDGIDIAAPEGTPVRAVGDGRVIYSGNELKGYGNLIIIKHEGKIFSVYAHNQVNLVEEGDFVKRGQIIARVGKTGRITGSHLHFEIREGKVPVNPLLYLPEK